MLNYDRFNPKNALLNQLQIDRLIMPYFSWNSSKELKSVENMQCAIHRSQVVVGLFWKLAKGIQTILALWNIDKNIWAS